MYSTLGFGLESLILMAIIIILAFFIHEFSKVIIANILSDDAVVEGVPIKRFIEPIGFILMYVYGFGWANGPKINCGRFQDRKKGAIYVYGGAIAISAFIGFLFMILGSNIISFIGVSGMSRTIATSLFAFGRTSLAVAIMNIIPMYPFSGYNLFFELSSPNRKMWLMNNKQTTQIVFIFLLMFGIMQIFMETILSIILLLF